MVTRRDYSEEAAQRAQSVLIEVIHLLGEFSDRIVLVGGMVPGLLLKDADEPYIGTVDIDLALDHTRMQEAGYKTIRSLLLGKGYIESEKQPFIFFRPISRDGLETRIEVDFLAGEYGGSGKSHRHQRIVDMHARKARGCDLCFTSPLAVSLTGTLPEGGIDTVTIRVSSIVPFMIMKSMALAERLKEKDSWDIFFCLKYYPGGLESLAEEFRPLLQNGLVREGLKNLAVKFASPEHIGPYHVADFYEYLPGEDRQIVQRDAYERMRRLLQLLNYTE